MKRHHSRRKFASTFRTGMAFLAISVITIPVFADPGPNTSEQIRKQLVTLSSYGVFDDLSFQIDGSVVTLTGYASRPILKSDAERSVRKIEGVQSVVNKIQVLPVSPMDDRIRLKTYLAIYRNPSLQRYSTGSGFTPRLTPLWAAGGITNNPPIGWHPIHIIVQNGNVTLTGVVDREMDKTIAGMAANRLSGVFGVTNNLAVASSDAKHDNTRKAES
jgi:hyperosmotically inducible periplasmic protein